MFKQKLFFAFALFLSAAPAHALQKGRYFDRAVFVIFENKNYADAMAQPFFKKLADEGSNFTNFLALTHPSQGNYIALTSGGLNGVTNDGVKTIDVPNIVDLLEARGIGWKVYAENYPGNCFVGGSAYGLYARKHNPFISYRDVQTNPARCAHIVEAAEFDRDLAAGTVPEYVFYIPNVKNDAHDTPIRFGNDWYEKKFSPVLANAAFMQNTVLVTTFDESAGGSRRNQIYTSIVGPGVKPGSYDDALTVPSLLRLVEDNWNLGDFGQLDRTATPIPAIWAP